MDIESNITENNDSIQSNIETSFAMPLGATVVNSDFSLSQYIADGGMFTVVDSIIKNSDDTFSASVPATQPLVLDDVTHTDSNGDPVVLPAMTPMVCTPAACSGADVTNSDNTYNQHVNDGDTLVLPDTIVKNTAGTTVLTQPSCTNTGVIADSVITNSDNTFSLNVPAESNPVLTDITHIDSDLTPIVLPAMTPMVCTPAATPEGWYPPADWGWDAASALINDGDNGFVGLIAVHPSVSNYCAILLAFTGTATIYWGDGTSEAITSDVKAQHQYDYALVSSAPTSEGYKAAVVRVVSTGAISKLLLGQYHNSQKAGAKGSWLAYKFRSTYSPANTVTTNFGMSENTALIDLGQMKISSFSSEKRSLLHLNLDPSLITLGSDMFSNSNVYNYDFSAQNWSALTSMQQMFHVTYFATNKKFEASIPNVTTLYFAFRICYAFSEVILHDSSDITEMYGAFNANDFIRRIEIDDCSAVNSTTAAISCANLESLILNGLTVGINVSSCNLSATALNAFFTSLGTANGAQTITVTGNPGAATCDTSIATAKGYTVVT